MRALFFIKLAGCVTFFSFATTAKDVVVELELVLAVDVFGSIEEANADCSASAM